ncbi:MAG: hypothetical protein HPKKFMNG_02779 [Planctomycetes bacterium]|nr:hypothetical protein [Planctomycetota bacterium]GIK53889.1 MAG: DNA-directed RNA polymerase sigma-70 factor [Planctomycetota bacterium]
MKAISEAMDQGAEFEEHRRHVFGVAYRMLGSVSDAEDAVQDVWQRYATAARPDNTRAWLTTVTTRLCIDRLRELKVRRETYVGPWLPEPLLTSQDSSADAPSIMAESLTLAFLTVLEKLNPVERAVFLLREVFEYEYADIAAMIEKSEANCRQILARAREHLKAPPRFSPAPQKQQELVARFLAAVQQGDLQDLIGLLAQDAVSVGDGGGKRLAAGRPVCGREHVARFWLGLSRMPHGAVELRAACFNQRPALVLYENGEATSVIVFDFDGERIARIDAQRNPDKLGRLPAKEALPRIV